MKKILLLFYLFLPYLSLAQDDEDYSSSTSERKCELQLGGGVTKLGYFGNIGFGYQATPKLSVVAAVTMEFGEINKSNFSNFFLKPGVAFTLNNPENRVHVNAVGGFIALYSTVKETISLATETKKSGFNVGAYIGPELELKIVESFSLNTYFHQAYLPLDFMGTTMFFVGGGIKIKF